MNNLSESQIRCIIRDSIRGSFRKSDVAKRGRRAYCSINGLRDQIFHDICTKLIDDDDIYEELGQLVEDGVLEVENKGEHTHPLYRSTESERDKSLAK